MRNRELNAALGCFITRDRDEWSINGEIVVTNLGRVDLAFLFWEPTAGGLSIRVPPFSSSSLNAYAYAGNSPERRIDPAGLDWLDSVTNNWFYKLLYTGNANISDTEYRLALVPAGNYTLCYVNCVKELNAELGAILIPGVGAELGGLYTASDLIPYPKALARLQGWEMTRFGTSQNAFTSRARLKSTCKVYTPEQRRAYRRLAELIKRGPRGQQLREIVQRAKPGARAGARAGVAALAIIELLIAGYCADSCGAFK